MTTPGARKVTRMKFHTEYPQTNRRHHTLFGYSGDLTARTCAAILTPPLHSVLGYSYIGTRTDTTQQSGQTPDKEAKIKIVTDYVSGYTETDTTGMLSPLTVWRFSVAADIDRNVFDFYFLIWSLSRRVVLCRFWLQCSRGLRWKISLLT
jgi:hypothetical protein